MKQSEELADIRSPGSHAFLLQARVKLFDEKGHANEGSYRLAWKAPDDWQDELTLTDFRQVRTAKVDKLFYSRSTRGLRPDVFHLLGLLEYPGHFDLKEPKRLKLRDKSENGVAERIVEYSPEGQSWKVTYDAKSPIVLRIEYSVHSVAYEYSDYVSFDQHQFPRLVKKSSRNKPLIEIQIQKLEEVDIKTYLTPPSDSRYLQWCPNLKCPKPIDNGNTHVPWPLGRQDVMTRPVGIYGVIGTDGLWHNLEIVESNSKEVDEFWMNRMLQQRFSPSKCGDSPVEYETVIEYSFP